jgi:hypothetical protein
MGFEETDSESLPGFGIRIRILEQKNKEKEEKITFLNNFSDCEN